MQRHEKGHPRVDVPGVPSQMTAAEVVPGRISQRTDNRGYRRPALAAVDAISERQTFTRDQAAYLVALAYGMGRRHAAAEDLAETVACWAEYAQPATTREQRVAARIASMPGTTPAPPLRFDDPDWPPVAVPGTVDVAELQSVWSVAA